MQCRFVRAVSVRTTSALGRLFSNNPKPQIPSHQETNKGAPPQATDLRPGPFGKRKTVQDNLEAEDLLNQKVSLRELRAQQLEKVDSEKFEKMIRIEEEVDLPYYLHGIQNKPDRKDNYIVQRMFSEHKVPDNFVLDYLFKVYMGTVKAMADRVHS